MRVPLLACLLSAAPLLAAGPASKEQLMTAPAGARHYTISSIAGKHGDIWSWTMPDGRLAYRMSMSLRGWVTEDDELVTLGADRRPSTIAVRGYTDQGDATENFSVDGGTARWKTTVDAGSATFAAKRYNSYGGPWLASELDVNALVAAGPKGIDLLPTGHASIAIAGEPVRIAGPGGAKTIRLAFITGYGFSPSPVWLDSSGRFFGNAGTISLLPEGYEASGPRLKDIQDKATAAMVRDVAHKFLAPANRTPTLIDHVLTFDSVAGRYLPDRAVLIADGKVVAVGAGGTIASPAGATVIDGRGKTLTPGLWDSHQHVGDDWNLLQNVATGMTNYRSPGSQIEDALSIYKRRAAGDLLAPDGKISVIIDKKDPLAAQGALTVSSVAETIAAVDKIKAAGLWGAKFYTSMDPAWIAPGAAEAHRLGLHVHGHVPAGMRPLDAVRAGYDEVTHINFIMMQAMPQDVVDKSNTAARLEGPARYGKDVDLDSPAMKAFYAELVAHHTIVDPTLVVWEPLMTSDGSAISPEYAPFAAIAPPSVARGWKISGYPLSAGLTRDDYRKSFAKMVELVGKLHQAGVPIVAGTDGPGLELVRELELYEQAGLTNVEALQTATIIPARMTGMADRTGSIAPGKTADVILVDGDVSRDITNLRHVETVFLDGYRLDGRALRQASGLNGVPN